MANTESILLESSKSILKNTPTILPIVIEPDPLLHLKSEKVLNVDDETRQFMDNMLATMYANNGVGLAAVQVGVLKKIIVIDVDQRTDNHSCINDACGHHPIQHGGEPLFMVNPEIIERSESLSEYKEGCLSFPGIYADVLRPDNITVQYLDYYGKEQKLVVPEGLLSVCIQHEIDHTNGIVFVDHLSKIKKEFYLKKLFKQKKRANAD